MNHSIHPHWNPQTPVTCVCGNTFTLGSTQDAIQVDICAKCHPFFTGEQRFVDRLGRVDRFRQKVAAAQPTKKKKAAKQTGSGEVLSFRDILKQAA